MGLVVIRLLTLPLLMVPILSWAQCVVVATVFSQSICQSDIALPEEQLGANAASELDSRLQLELLRIEKAHLLYKIRAVAAEHLLPKGSYRPSQDEIDLFEDFMVRSRARETRDEKEILAAAEHLLKTHEYEERFRQSLRDTIASAKRIIVVYERIDDEKRANEEDRRKRFGDEAVVKFRQQRVRSRRGNSERWVARWKMNKALHKKYGGRIIFQQAGIEPIDAYREYLKDIRGKGDLKILASNYADVFDELDRYLDMDHHYMSEEEYLREAGEEVFGQPYWETADLDAMQRRRLKELEEIPHK